MGLWVDVLGLIRALDGVYRFCAGCRICVLTGSEKIRFEGLSLGSGFKGVGVLYTK